MLLLPVSLSHHHTMTKLKLKWHWSHAVHHICLKTPQLTQTTGAGVQPSPDRDALEQMCFMFQQPPQNSNFVSLRLFWQSDLKDIGHEASKDIFSSSVFLFCAKKRKKEKKSQNVSIFDIERIYCTLYSRNESILVHLPCFIWSCLIDFCLLRNEPSANTCFQ